MSKCAASPDLEAELSTIRRWIDDPDNCLTPLVRKRFRQLIAMVVREEKRGNDHLDEFSRASKELERLYKVLETVEGQSDDPWARSWAAEALEERSR
jgi:hypothetical protein